jgi:hypothetical protein
MPIVLNGTTGITAPTYNGSVAAEYLVPVTGFKNRIINGDMTIDQRNNGAAVTNANGYTLDRWILSEDSTGGVTVQQDTVAPTGFRNSFKVTVTTADAVSATEYVMLRQKIEGFNVADLMWGTASAQTVTLSFWVRSSLTGTFGGTILNASQARIYPYTYTINAANTWEYKTVTIPGDTTGTWLTTNGTGMEVIFGLGVGTDYSGTPNSWSGTFALSATGAVSVIGTLGATWQVTGVQLEKGSNATSFDYLPYGTELALCQRYCFAYSAADAAFANLSSAMTNGTTANFAHVFVSLPVTMRVKPNALTLSAQSDFAVTDFSGSFAWTGVALNASNSTPNLVHLEGSIAGGSSTGRYYEARANGATAARLTLTAEL